MENKESDSSNLRKYILIISGVIIVSIVSYYYFDNIKDGFTTSFEWLRNNFSRPPTDPGTNKLDSNNILLPNTQSSTESVERRWDWKRYFRLNPETSNRNVSDIGLNKDLAYIKKAISDLDSDTDSVIEMIDTTNQSIDKGKTILTSPSLENLNNEAQKSFESNILPEFIEGSSSLKSDDSSSTITPSSSNLLSHSYYSERYWKYLLPGKERDKFKFIEDIINSSKELDIETSNKLCETLVDIIISYNKEIEIYENLETSNKILMRENLFYFKKWIKKYHELILPNSDTIIMNLDLTNISDEPTSIIIK